ncbi:hypothetical protein LY78DRAFT_732545 [Colletotrichum sublineola]|nr:hypothetical protein LY78DRAFT_732545 [Colletotrichum sublineola]
MAESPKNEDVFQKATRLQQESIKREQRRQAKREERRIQDQGFLLGQTPNRRHEQRHAPATGGSGHGPDAQSGDANMPGSFNPIPDRANDTRHQGTEGNTKDILSSTAPQTQAAQASNNKDKDKEDCSIADLVYLFVLGLVSLSWRAAWLVLRYAIPVMPALIVVLVVVLLVTNLVAKAVDLFAEIVARNPVLNLLWSVGGKIGDLLVWVGRASSGAEAANAVGMAMAAASSASAAATVMTATTMPQPTPTPQMEALIPGAQNMQWGMEYLGNASIGEPRTAAVDMLAMTLATVDEAGMAGWNDDWCNVRKTAEVMVQVETACSSAMSERLLSEYTRARAMLDDIQRVQDEEADGIDVLAGQVEGLVHLLEEAVAARQRWMDDLVEGEIRETTSLMHGLAQGTVRTRPSWVSINGNNENKNNNDNDNNGGDQEQLRVASLSMATHQLRGWQAAAASVCVGAAGALNKLAARHNDLGREMWLHERHYASALLLLDNVKRAQVATRKSGSQCRRSKAEMEDLEARRKRLEGDLERSVSGFLDNLQDLWYV